MGCSDAGEPSAIPGALPAQSGGEMPIFERPELSSVRDGLDAAHRDQTPIFDRFQEGRERKYLRGERLYSDGTRYWIKRHLRGTTAEAHAWRKQAVFTAAGIKLVKDALYPIHGEHSHSHTASSPSTGAGSTTWVSYLEGKELVFRTGEAPFACPVGVRNAVDLALMKNVVPRSSR